jgi:ferredoxin-thioredoxin reductase catalytic chain
MMVTEQEMQARVQRDADESGYFICPDRDLLRELIDGLVKNEERYGYGSCPCRISSGVKAYDADIICPCEYRDADVDEFGMCYCGLFVSKAVKEDPKKLMPITERRPEAVIDEAVKAKERRGRGEKEEDVSTATAPAEGGKEGIPVWRCKVCGYLAAREHPPSVCPICKAKKDRFERFTLL